MKISKETSNILVIKENKLLVFILSFIFALLGFLRVLNIAFYSGPNTMPLSMALYFLAIGIFIITVTKIKNITFDKIANKLIIKSKSLLKRSTEEYELTQIKEVQLRQFYYKSKADRAGTAQATKLSYLIVLVLNNGDELTLNKDTQSSINIMGIRQPKEGVIAKR